MSDLKQLAYKAINLGKQLQAVIDIGEALDELGDLDQASVEANELKNKSQRESEKAKNYLDELNDKIKQIELDHSELKQNYTKLIDDTKQRCNFMLGQARSKKEEIISIATVGANKILDDANIEVDILKKERDSLSKEIEQLTAQLKNLRDEMQVLRERLG